MQNQIELYTHPLSPNGRKILAMCDHLGLNPKINLINVYLFEGQADDYLKINLLGQIPTIVDKHHDCTIVESNAILIYLAENYANNQLYPVEVPQRASINQWLFWEASQWQPALSAILCDAVGHKLLPTIIAAPKQPPQWDELNISKQLHYLNTHLSQNTYLAGDDLTIADFSVAGMMIYFRFAEFPFEDYPGIRDWFNIIEELPAWQQSKTTLWGC